MANETDPLARHIHGTNPQNLIEYITRQKIYDSQYWKEECFGLSAVDIAEKAATQIKAVGGSYGGNSKPTRFLCLVLKMLQIQPDDEIVDELVQNEDFKYVRALGAFYLRLTGRPADIYTKLEPLYNDYRPIRRRDATQWSLVTMDEYVDDLLREDRVCGIAMPRLPKREVLVESGYLDGPRRSALFQLMEEESPRGVEEALAKLAADGNTAAREALEQRGKVHLVDGEKKEEEEVAVEADVEAEKDDQQYDNAEKERVGDSREMRARSRSSSRSRSWGRREKSHRHHDDRGDDIDDRRGRKDREHRHRHHDRAGRRGRSRSYDRHDRHDDRRHDERKRERKRDGKKKDKDRGEKKKKKEKNKYGSLFKSSKDEEQGSHNRDRKEKLERIAAAPEPSGDGGAVEGSEEYWNAERAKLGLAPLRK